MSFSLSASTMRNAGNFILSAAQSGFIVHSMFGFGWIPFAVAAAVGGAGMWMGWQSSSVTPPTA